MEPRQTFRLVQFTCEPNPHTCTWVVNVFVEMEVTASCVIDVGVVVRREVAKLWWHQDTFLPQVSHEELQTNQSKDTEAEHSQDHDITQLLH